MQFSVMNSNAKFVCEKESVVENQKNKERVSAKPKILHALSGWSHFFHAARNEFGVPKKTAGFQDYLAEARWRAEAELERAKAAMIVRRA